jgi:hypothetical protein
VTALLAPIPQGDGPKCAHKRLRFALSRLARRVALAALIAHREDVLLEVYCAGVAHGVAMMEGEANGRKDQAP